MGVDSVVDLDVEVDFGLCDLLSFHGLNGIVQKQT